MYLFEPQQRDMTSQIQGQTFTREPHTGMQHVLSP